MTEIISHFDGSNNIFADCKSFRGETPYTCDLCDEKFSTKKRLYGHRKIHTEIHTCDVCDKSFSRNKDLRVHKLEHGEKKKFVCDHCPYSFTYKVSKIIYK